VANINQIKFYLTLMVLCWFRTATPLSQGCTHFEDPLTLVSEI